MKTKRIADKIQSESRARGRAAARRPVSYPSRDATKTCTRCKEPMQPKPGETLSQWNERKTHQTQRCYDKARMEQIDRLARKSHLQHSQTPQGGGSTERPVRVYEFVTGLYQIQQRDFPILQIDARASNIWNQTDRA